MRHLRRTADPVIAPRLLRLRRRMARFPWITRSVPWSLWCRLAAYNALAVTWRIALDAGRPLSFVQIGSNDGIVLDPLHDVVVQCGWSGVLVEPMPELFEQLKANYGDTPGLSYENAAIGVADGRSTIFTVRPGPGDPYWTNQLASFDRDAILVHSDEIKDLEDRIEEVAIDALTLPSLVARHGIERIDVLHIDAEGFDHEIIKQIDFDARWAPRFLIYEQEHFDRGTHRDVRRLLRGAGYQLVNIWPDELAYRTGPS